MAHVVVVGGGIAGLAAAHDLLSRAPAGGDPLRVTVLEGAPRLGGALHRHEVGGVPVDVGAEAMLRRRPEGVGLAVAVGLADDLADPATTAAGLWLGDRLVPMPRTLWGVPADTGALADVLSEAGLARATHDAGDDVPPPGTDLSVGALVEQRLGGEVVDRLVEPLLGGVYAGHAREISARAAVPQLLTLLQRHGSLTAAAAAALPAPGAAAAPVFAGVRGGVARLPVAVAAHLEAAGATVRTRATVRRLERLPAGRWRLVVGSAHDPEALDADAVVLATPARTSARLLTDVAPVAAAGLGEVESASVAVVTMAVPAPDLPPTRGSGFLVPPTERRTIKAATFSFAKWAWVREAGASRAPGGDDLLLLRVSLGRHREERVLQHDDGELVDVALADLRLALGGEVRPVDAHVQRWGGALPQYAVGHLDRVAAVRREVAALPGLAVCGAAYDGVGVPACIASARLAVTGLLPRLATMGP